MRHNKKFNHLGRTKSHREAMLANMTVSLIRAKRINTTVAKAKLRIYAEPIINRAKEDTTNSRRIVFSYLQDKEAVKELFGDIAVKIANRPGGYLRILKLGQNRLGDNAEMAMIEFVDYNENLLKDNVEKKSKTRRSRSKKAAEAAPAAEPEAKAE